MQGVWELAWGEQTLGHTELLNLNQSGRTRMSPSVPPPLSLSRPFFSSRVPSPQSILEKSKGFSLEPSSPPPHLLHS